MRALFLIICLFTSLPVWSQYVPKALFYRDMNTRLFKHFLLGVEYGYYYDKWTLSTGVDLFNTLEWWIMLDNHSHRYFEDFDETSQTSLQLRF